MNLFRKKPKPEIVKISEVDGWFSVNEKIPECYTAVICTDNLDGLLRINIGYIWDDNENWSLHQLISKDSSTGYPVGKNFVKYWKPL
jgi:hypothetical protein